MGAPLVGQERLTDSRTIARAVALMEEHHRPASSARSCRSRSAAATAIQPLMAAAISSRPVIDADTMGRAYPEAQMTSLRGRRPHALPADASSTCAASRSWSHKVPTWKWMERVSRKVCAEIRLDRLHLQGAAHRRARSRSGASTAPRPRRSRIGRGGARGAAPRTTIRSPPSWRSSRARSFQGQGDRRRPPHHRGLPARRARFDGLDE